MKKRYGIAVAGILLGLLPLSPVLAEEESGWRAEEGGRYWYEKGIRQGTEGRGKEIYDPGSDAWYWLDAVDGGRMAAGKDVYQDSEAGLYAEQPDGTGKWCRYDRDGHMVKGWDITESGTWYFDLSYGTMVKGEAVIDGVTYRFHPETGVMEYSSVGMDSHWESVDGRDYWYEGGIRQGYDGTDPSYRGKEIYDPGSDAWYWLDNVQQGARAVGKDVYQESLGGAWAEREDGTGKWVRYDEDGHMVKGWSADRRYYFDPVYGTMAKGHVSIDGQEYDFQEQTGILEREEPEPDEPPGDPEGLEWEIRDGTLIVTGRMEGLPDWGWYSANGTRLDYWSWQNAPWIKRKNEITAAKLDFTGAESMNRLFSNYQKLKSVDLSSLDTSKVTDMSYMFYSCRDLRELDLGYLDTSNTVFMKDMFGWCTQLRSLNLRGIDTSKVTDMAGMFMYCFHLEPLDLSGFDTSLVTDMESMFRECHDLESLDLSGFATGNVTSMDHMFANCGALRELGLEGWDTYRVTDMRSMFLGCLGLTELDLSGFGTGAVTSMNNMFYNCASLKKLHLADFDTSHVTDMGEMFANCSELENLDLRSFHTGSVKYAVDIFSKCTNMKEILVGEGWTLEDWDSFFVDCGVDHVTRK